MCSWCRSRTEFCGMCRLPYPGAPIICLVAAGLAAEIIVPCRHEEMGCTVQLTVERKLAHEQQCDWTPKACPHHHESRYPVMVTTETIVSHLGNAHHCEVIVGEEDQLTIRASQVRHLLGQNWMWQRSGRWYHLAIRRHVNNINGSLFAVLRLCRGLVETCALTERHRAPLGIERDV